jgi:NADH-ubiquinone oxidoreductase chain 6
MDWLFILNENFTNGYKDMFLDVVSIMGIICGVFVIISKNPIISILFLIGLFLSVSSYLILLGINFIGLSYLLVYIGAVSILFLFILMLINIRISELLNETNNGIPLAIIIGISFNYPIYEILPSNLTNLSLGNLLNTHIYKEFSYYINKPFSGSMDNNIYYVTSKMWDGSLAETTHITSIGNIIYTSHSLWLILTSLILLLGMVGAIVITIKQKN